MYDFENLNQQEREALYNDLSKALTTENYAQINGPHAQVGGSAFMLESLDSTLRTLTYSRDNIKLWRNIPKSKAYSTVEEYNKVNSYGEDVSAFAYEGEAGIETSGDYQRDFAKIKCMTVTRSVTHLATLTRMTENPETLEARNGVNDLLGKVETSLFYGDSTLAANGKEGVEWDGLLKQVNKANHIDLKGEYLTDKIINKGAEIVANNYGFANNLYAPLSVVSKFSEQYYPEQRALMSADAGTLVAGTTITKFNSAFGTMDLTPDVFMNRGIKALDINRDAVGFHVPTAPKAEAAAGTDKAVNEFEEGIYKYAVVAVGIGAQAAPVQATPFTVTGEAKTKSVKLTITNDPNQQIAAEYFIIYRTEANKEEYYEIGRVGAKTTDKSGVTEFVDDNSTLPNTGQIIIGDFDPMNLQFKQLMDIFKMDYAVVGPRKRFGIFLYGAPVMYNPNKFVVVKNIKVK